MNAEADLTNSMLGIELVRVLAAQGDRIFSTDRARELAPRVGMKDAYLLEALFHLRRTGWIVPLRRGLYAISSAAVGVAGVHEFEIAMALANPAAVSHWTALHYHGLTEQVPRKVFVTTTTETSVPRARGPKAKQHEQGFVVGGVKYQFVQVRPARFFGTQKVWIGEVRVTMTDPERTLLDGLCMPQHFGDFAEVLHAFDVRRTDLDAARIVDYALKLDAAVAKRLGWVLERRGIDPSKLAPLAALPIKGYRPLDPTGPRKGPCDRRWMIQENLPGRIGS